MKNSRKMKVKKWSYTEINERKMREKCKSL
jgi:hypothetical protein